MSKYDDWERDFYEGFDDIDRKYGIDPIRREEKVSEIRNNSVGAGRTSKRQINRNKIRDKNKRFQKMVSTITLCIFLAGGIAGYLGNDLIARTVEYCKLEDQMMTYTHDMMIEQGLGVRDKDGYFYLNWNEDFKDNSIVVENSEKGVATLVLWDDSIGCAMNGNESAKNMFYQATMIKGADGTYYSISDISRNKRDTEFIDSLGLDEAMMNYLCGSYSSLIKEISNANELINEARHQAKNGDYTLYEEIFNGVQTEKKISK